MLLFVAFLMAGAALTALFHLTRISGIYRVTAQWRGFRKWEYMGRDYYLDVVRLTLPGGQAAQANVPPWRKIEYAADGAVRAFSLTNQGTPPFADPRLYIGIAAYCFLGADCAAAAMFNYRLPAWVMYGEAALCLGALIYRRINPLRPDWEAVRKKLARDDREAARWAPVERVPFSERKKARKTEFRVKKAKLAGIALVLAFTALIACIDWNRMQVIFHPHLSATGHVQSLSGGRHGTCNMTVVYRDKDHREHKAQVVGDILAPACNEGALMQIIYDPQQKFDPAPDQHGWGILSSVLFLAACLVVCALVIAAY